MNTLSIVILAFIVFFIIYFVSLYISAASVFDAPISLKCDTGVCKTITPTEIYNPSSVHYYYSAWIHLDGTTPAKNCVLFNRGKMAVCLKGTALSLDPNANIDGATRLNTPSDKAIEITRSFPLQKWVYLAINVDSQIIDIYLEGKLLSSTTIVGLDISPDPQTPIQIGNRDTNGRITRFKCNSFNVTPSDIQRELVVGSGQSNSPNGSKYGVKLGVLNNDRPLYQFNLI